MTPEQQPVQNKSDEDRLMQLEEDLYALHRQIARLEERIRKAQELVKALDLSVSLTPSTQTQNS